MFYKHLLIGIVLVLVGVILIIYGIPSSHFAEGIDTWYQKIGHFFVDTWHKVTGYKEPPPPSKHTARSIGFLIGGILLVALGGLVIFRKFRRE
jgi:LPXTG-motif cell wall-anchored protein